MYLYTTTSLNTFLLILRVISFTNKWVILNNASFISSKNASFWIIRHLSTQTIWQENRLKSFIPSSSEPWWVAKDNKSTYNTSLTTTSSTNFLLILRHFSRWVPFASKKCVTFCFENVSFWTMRHFFRQKMRHFEKSVISQLKQSDKKTEWKV